MTSDAHGPVISVMLAVPDAAAAARWYARVEVFVDGPTASYAARKARKRSSRPGPHPLATHRTRNGLLAVGSARASSCSGRQAGGGRWRRFG
jgi:hypothetical protein